MEILITLLSCYDTISIECHTRMHNSTLVYIPLLSLWARKNIQLFVVYKYQYKVVIWLLVYFPRPWFYSDCAYLLRILELDIIVELLNKQATMILNPGTKTSRLFKRFDSRLQIDFKSVLIYCKFTTRDEWTKLKKDSKRDSPEWKA